MDYVAGINRMVNLIQALAAGQQQLFNVGTLLITYPGYKKPGDYKLSENGQAPKHTDIVNLINTHTNAGNLNSVITFLDDVYLNGLHATATLINPQFKEKIFWITLLEEIIYPQPRFAGRKLPFQRYFEAALIHRGLNTLADVYKRTNNHGGSRPPLLKLSGVTIPCFYI